jgi:uncharacterized protein (DUF2235 family)
MDTSRHIILLSDGTGNSRGKLEQTNVWRTWEAIDLKDAPTPDQPRQFAYYDDGVGTSSFKPLAILGGALGYGLARNVRDLYEFLCRTYRDGDNIYAFGFSRGAFTIRVLIGLISNQGLVPYRGDEAELRRLSKAAFRAYRRERYKLVLNWIALPRMLRDTVIDAWARLRGFRRYAEVAKKKMVDVHFVGVWDTVAAYGMPVDEMAIFLNAVVWPLDMPDPHLSTKVRRAAHALALDDERYTFHPKPWAPDERIKQVWFAGMHSDVGGGYADKGLAHVSLNWMLTEAENAGLRLLPSVRTLQRALADENGPMNDSRRGLAGYYRYKPRNLPAGAVVHQSVLRRIQVGQDAYAPIVLPPDFKVMGFDGAVRPGGELLKDFEPGAYARGRDRVMNRVWLRRGVYFATVAATLVLLLQPLLRSAEGGACTTGWCWLSPAIRALQVALPSTLEAWAVWYAANPGLFLLLGGATAVLLWCGALVQRRIFDCMRGVWYRMPELRPTSLEAGAPSVSTGSILGRAITALRTSKGYQAAIHTLRRKIFPTAFGMGLVSVTAMLATSLWFAIRASDGDFCIPSAPLTTVGPSVPASGSFANDQACAATGFELLAGGTYEIVLTIGAPEQWLDDKLTANWRGIEKPPLAHRLAILIKRELTQPIFAPMARIGSKGADVYPLPPDPSQPRDMSRTQLHSRIVARTDGELFLYVNDVVGPPWDPLKFYRNNHGVASFVVRQVVPEQVPAPPAP